MTRILIVDADQHFRGESRALLEVAGYEVEEAEDGAEALLVITAMLPDLVLLDVRMPELSGFEVLNRMRADPNLSTIPVILVSASRGSEPKVRGLELGANDYVEKPCDQAELLARVRAHLRIASMVPPSHRAGGSSTPAPNPTTSVTRLSDHDHEEHFLLDGRYRIEGVLGEGGMGKVYLATHVELGREVAIKILSSRVQERDLEARRLAREAKLAGTLGHPNICQVYDMGRLEDGTPYVVMEKLDGQTLSERIYLEGALSFDDSLRFLEQVLSALDAAHRSGILHRDIKPDNVFLASNAAGEVAAKILDFGIATLAQFAGIDSRRGQMLGTPRYMAPEQFSGGDTDERTDLYGCGVLLNEMITGRPPFPEKDVNTLRASVLDKPPPDPRSWRPKTPDSIAALIERAMAKKPAERFESADQFLIALRSVRSELLAS
jgi:eukaryotic-like serine/threonine-protein kinase